MSLGSVLPFGYLCRVFANTLLDLFNRFLLPGTRLGKTDDGGGNFFQIAFIIDKYGRLSVAHATSTRRPPLAIASPPPLPSSARPAKRRMRRWLPDLLAPRAPPVTPDY